MNGNDCVLDTCFVIDYLRGAASAVRCLERLASLGAAFHVCELTMAELLSARSLTARDEEVLSLFADEVAIQPLNGEIIERAIALGPFTRRMLPDVIVAATAVFLGAPLITSDRFFAAATLPGFRAATPEEVIGNGILGFAAR